VEVRYGSKANVGLMKQERLLYSAQLTSKGWGWGEIGRWCAPASRLKAAFIVVWGVSLRLTASAWSDLCFHFLQKIWKWDKQAYPVD
jgi:hypothetical protein